MQILSKKIKKVKLDGSLRLVGSQWSVLECDRNKEKLNWNSHEWISWFK